MSKWMISFLSIVAVASMFSGCGSEGSSKASGSSTETNTQTQPVVDYDGQTVQGVKGLNDLPGIPALPEG